MNKYHKLFIAIAATGLVAGGQFVSAQTATPTQITNARVIRQVTISTTGRATLQGVISSNFASSTSGTTSTTTTGNTPSSTPIGQFTMNTWGGDWTINITSSSKVRGSEGFIINPLEVQNGDRVLATGQANTTTASIAATGFTDRSIQRRTLTGKVSGTGTQNGMFTITTSRGFQLMVQPLVTGASPTVSGSGITSVSGLTDGMTVRATGDLDLSNSFFFVTRIVVTSASGATNPSPSTTTSTPPSTPSTTTAPTSTTPTTTTTSTMPTASGNVTIANFAFSPSNTTVSSGSAVTWTNNDTVSHTVTADNGSFDSGVLQPGATFTHTFTQAGSVPYHCSIHPSMHGSVSVQ